MKRALRALFVIAIIGSTLTPLSAGAVVVSNPTPDCSAGTTCTVTFSYVGDYYAWTVPSGVTSITFDVYGAQGGDGTNPACSPNTSYGLGGQGGRVAGTLSVTTGSALYFYVGGRGPSAQLQGNGGWNGGGGTYATGTPCYPGAGGGASDIRTSAGILSSRLVVAGGGGGGSGWTTGGGGAGGTATGQTGFADCYSQCGTGGTQSGGGTGANSGSLGTGGRGTGGSHGGGGGGGGYYGGGGGYVGAGGGGSSYYNTTYVSATANTSGGRTGNGLITVTYLNSPIPTTFSTSQSSPTNISTSGTISYSLVLSQSVSDLAVTDFQLGGTSTCNTPGLSGSTSTYTVTLTNCTEGTVILQLKANSITGNSTGPPTISSANTIVIDRTAPTITSVTAPANKTYIPTETPTFTMVFSESVTVTGAPRIALTVGSLSKYANFVEMTDSKTALFRYTVTKTTGEFDTDGIAIASTTLDLNGGSIADLATNALSPVTFSAPTLTSVLVAQPVSAPTITSITPGNTQLTVNFTEGSTNGSAITNYKYSLNGGTFTAASPVDTATPLVITGLTNGTAYSVRILAINAAGDGDSSTAVSATPSTVVVAGGSNISRVYGTTSTTSAFTASGGTAPYVFSLSGGTAGISIDTSTGVVTASNTLAVGTYTPSVVATDSNGTPRIGSLGMSIVILQDTPTATIALPNSAINAALGGAVTITASVSKDGVLVFKADGSTISGCSAVSSSAGTATCSWTPGALGGVVLTAILTPTDSTNYRSVTTIGLSITVVNGVSTVSLSLTGGVTQAPKGQAINIIAAISQSGKVSFFADGKRIAGCFNMSATAGNKSCSWKPTVQKQVNLTATLNPTNNVYNNSTSSLMVWVIRRSGTR